jgi:glycerophosphoryl diester phosphodiesterase
VPELAAQPWVIAHRGDHRQATENSLASFDAAIRSGCDMIETDLRRCLDGVVAYHDARVGGRPVSSMTRREIFDETGVLPPVLTELLEHCHGRIGLDLEIKEAGLEAEVLGAVTPSFSPSEYFISSFLTSVLRTVRELDAATRTGLLSARGLNGLMRARGVDPDPRSADGIVAEMKECGVDYLIPDDLDHELITCAARTGTALILWNANSGDRISEAINHRYVAGVITDSPHLMRNSLH